ncbi:MAG: dephospho-CoA kinase, partial [Chitinivibrionales bacterium]|nr:dephospho-CoA kinase [Chitinivibrionales bacterium]
LHPLILHDIEQQLAQIAASEPDAITVVDLPLLVECGLQKKFDCIVMVYTSRKIQIQRLMKRDRISKREALHRLSTQMDIEEKKHHAHYIIENNGTLDMLARQVRYVYARLCRNRM